MGLLGKWVESLDYEYEILSTCSRHLSPRSSCQACMDVCEVKAISLEKGKPVISQENCTECGKCISACPVQAVAGIYPRRSVMQNKLVATGKAAPTAKELVILHAKGIKEIVADSQESLEEWKQPIDAANEMLAELEKEAFQVKVDKIKSKDESYTRRELFSIWKKESTSLLKLATPAKWRFNHEDFSLAKHYPDYQFVQIAIDTEKCTVCTACQRICKQKCFEIQEEGFMISPFSCNTCQICADICPEKAIVVENRIAKKQEEPTSLPIYKNTCKKCERTFDSLNPEEDKCIICKKRELYVKE